MTKFKILGAAAILASALASPAMAQEVIYNPGYCAQFYPNANCQNKGPGNPYTGSYQQTYGNQAYRRNDGWQNSNNRWDGDRDSVVVGRASGTIGGDEYARRNGFVCIPGTLFRGEDGRQHICQ